MAGPMRSEAPQCAASARQVCVNHREAYRKHGQSILYTSAEISDCIAQRGGGPLRCRHKFEEPQLLHRNGLWQQASRGFRAIDDQGFVRRQGNQGALW